MRNYSLSVFVHFVGLALKGLKNVIGKELRIEKKSMPVKDVTVQIGSFDFM